MTTNTIVAITAIGFIGLYFFNKARTAGFLNYKINRVSISFSGITPVLRFDVGIDNPSGNSFTIKSMTGTLYGNNVELGTVTSYNTVVVTPNSASVYPLYIKLSILGVVDTAVGIISDIVATFNGNGRAQQVEFDGAANVDNLTVPINFKYTIG